MSGAIPCSHLRISTDRREAGVAHCTFQVATLNSILLLCIVLPYCPRFDSRSMSAVWTQVK